MLKVVTSATLALLCTLCFAQADLGWDNLPAPTDTIWTLPYIGEPGDFSGGAQIGELCPDITVYDLNGNPINLYESLRPDKHTILVSMSQSCVRVMQGFDPNQMAEPLNFMNEYMDDFNWIPIYVEEAHPADAENCPSNCTGTVILSLDGDSIFSHQTYNDRRCLAEELIFFGNAPQFDFTYPFSNMYLDNPDNGAMAEIFQAPFGMVVLDCAGEVIIKAPFMSEYLQDTGNWSSLISLAEQADSDNDLICNIREEFLGTDPFDPCDPLGGDTDGDGYCDLLEEQQGTNPYNPCSPWIDEDGNGICDFDDQEVDVPLCEEDPTDTDGDGICDAQENEDGTNPNNPCSPNNTDTDGDGFCDIYEELNGFGVLDPCDPDGMDSDGDGYCDNLEEITESDPQNPCDPEFVDSDGDGYCNLEEIQNGWDPGDECSPNDEDSDQDGYCDENEAQESTDPTDPCDPNDLDADEDGLCDVQESIDGTDPNDPCDPDNTDTDGDGTCDLQEILDGTDPFVDETVGLSELAAGIRVYPNPVEDQLIIQSKVVVQSVEVLAVSGQQVAFMRSAGSLDVSNLAAGVYTVRILLEDGTLVIRRVVK